MALAAGPLPVRALGKVVGAYGNRLLIPEYTGPCTRLRRGSDNAEADVWFDHVSTPKFARLLHTGHPLGAQELAAWLSQSVIYVAVWYDQGGSGRNVTQEAFSNEPLLVLRDGRHWLQVDGSQFLEVRDDAFNLRELTLLVNLGSTHDHFDWMNIVSKIESHGARTFGVWVCTRYCIHARNVLKWQKCVGSNCEHTFLHVDEGLPSTQSTRIAGTMDLTSVRAAANGVLSPVVTSTATASNVGPFNIGGTHRAHSAFRGDIEFVIVLSESLDLLVADRLLEDILHPPLALSGQVAGVRLRVHHCVLLGSLEM